MRGDLQASPLALSVVIPVYRNAATVEVLHRELARVLDAHNLAFETIFVDDACPERSSEVLQCLTTRDHRVRVLTHETNRGQHRAVLTGLAVARADCVVVLDADLQDPPDAIPEMLAAKNKGFEAVFAGRRGDYESAGRLATSRLFKRLLSVLCGVPPDAGIFVAMSRPVVERVLTMAQGNSSVVALVGMSGLPVTSIPVQRRRRPHGHSAYSSWGRVCAGMGTVLCVLRWKLRSHTRAESHPPLS